MEDGDVLGHDGIGNKMGKEAYGGRRGGCGGWYPSSAIGTEGLAEGRVMCQHHETVTIYITDWADEGPASANFVVTYPDMKEGTRLYHQSPRRCAVQETG